MSSLNPTREEVARARELRRAKLQGRIEGHHRADAAHNPKVCISAYLQSEAFVTALAEGLHLKHGHAGPIPHYLCDNEARAIAEAMRLKS